MRNTTRKAIKKFIAGLLCSIVILEQAGIPIYVQAAELGSGAAVTTAAVEGTQSPEVTVPPQTTVVPPVTDIPSASDASTLPSPWEIIETPAVTESPEVTDPTNITDTSDVTDTSDTTVGSEPSWADEADPAADVESEIDWRTAAEALGLTGDIRQDVLLMAQSQLGYNESFRNYIEENGVKQGYTRYGQWCGNPYGSWNTAFVGFCLYYAGMEDVPFHPDCLQWIEQLKLNDELNQTGLYRGFGEYQPEAGDVVFFKTVDETGLILSTRAGIIAALTEDGFVTIEGDNGPVRYCEYSNYAMDANSVLGYIVMPGNSDEIEYIEQTIFDENYFVSVSGSLPEGAQVIARMLDESETEAFGFAESKLAFAYDIDILVNGEKCELVSPVNVKILSADNPEGKPADVVHGVTDEFGNISWETVESGIDEDGMIVFTAEGFSVYVGTIPYSWAGLDDETFAAWVTSGEHDAELKAIEEEQGQEYEDFNQRLDEIISQEIQNYVMQYIADLNGLDNSISTMALETAAFNSICKSVFEIDYDSFKNNANYAEVYVGYNEGGEQTGDLGTSAKPYGTVNAAYSSLSSKSGVIIHLLESYNRMNEDISTWPDTQVPAIIVSEAYETAILNMSGLKWNFSANTGFYNVKIKLTYPDNSTAVIFANGHNIVFGGIGENNFEFINDEASRYYPTLFGASEKSTGTRISHSSVENTHLEVYGGKWSQIFGGGEYYSDVSDTATVIVDGSYMENGTSKTGAVTFADNGLFYMEGSSNIYGGGAGDYTNLANDNYSKVANTNVRISHITTAKYLTPCGGNVITSAKIDLDYVTAKGVNARSEGSSSDAVSIVINNSTISEYVGALGDNAGGVKQAYKIVSDINDFDITITNSNVKALYVKSGALADGSYNNYVTGVDLCLEDSTFTDVITLARLPANYTSGTVNLLRLKNVKCSKYRSEANFGEINKIELIEIGTADAPFKWENLTFGSVNYGNVNSVSESLLIQNSYIDYGINYSTQSLTLKGNSQIRLKKDLSIETSDFEGDAASQITLEDGSTINISGNVTGTGITVDPEFSTEKASAQILWSRGSNSTNLSYVSSPEKEGYQFTKDNTARMDIWKWYNDTLPVSGYSYVYVDGELGHDNVNEYAPGSCTDETLGYNKLYPVKTFEKAYLLCKNSNSVIVLCGEYNLTVGATPVSLLGNAEAKEFSVRIQSTDDINDYRNVAKLHFEGTTGNVTLSAPLIFDNINLESSVANGAVRIFSNGNKTEYGAGVNIIRVGEDCSVEVYGGADGANVASTDLTVRAAYFNKIGAVGKDDTASVGNSGLAESDSSINKIVAKLTVEENNQCASYICYFGTAYGSVDTRLSYAVGTKYIYLNSVSGSTVYGDFYTDVSCGNNDKKYANVVPNGLTVKGKVSFIDRSDKTRYDHIYLQNGNFNNVDIDMSVEGINSVSLFDTSTKANNIVWNISGKVSEVFGKNGNTNINDGTMSVNVVLDNTATTKIRACSSDGGNRVETVNSGYPENDKIKVTLKNFEKGSYLDELWGFGSIEFDNSNILVKSEISAKNITVDQGSVVVFANQAAIGSAQGTGKLTLQNGGSLEVRNPITVNGDMYGGVSADSAGTLIDNWVNANDETVMITVTGQSTGCTYFSTDYSSAEIKVVGNTYGNEYMAPKLPSELPQMTITCIPPAAVDSPVNGRIWTVANPVSKKYIFVNGTIDSSAADYTSHNGSTPELAFATLEEAYDAVLNNGYIILCGDISLSSWPKNGTKSVTLTSKVTIGEGDSARTYDYFSTQSSHLDIKDNLELKGVTTFEYLNIRAEKQYVIGACGNKLVMGRQGDPNSLIMTNSSISVGGGGYDNIYYNMNSDLTIHAGNYNIVSGGNSGGLNHFESTYSSVKITIDGGTFQSVYAKYNLYDHFSTANEISLSIRNARVENMISAIGTNYLVGNTYLVDIGENMEFGESCYIRTSATTINYTSAPAPDITFTIDGGTGTRYKIPTIYGGPSAYNGNNTMAEKVTVNLKNVDVGTFICGSSALNLQEKTGGSMQLFLNENVHVSELYFGGSMQAGASAKVFVKSDQAIIDKLHSCSEFSMSTPETCELTYYNVGIDSENPYVLNDGVCLDGLTKFVLANARVDLSQVGNTITVGEIDASDNGKIIHRGRNLTLNANYKAGTSDKPTIWYGQNAPRIVINGTVSGTTHLQSLSADPSAEDGGVTGKFYNGISVMAKHSESHNENNFFGYSTVDNSLVWQPLTFTSGTETDTDTWEKTDEGDTPDRIQVYVSSEGSDSNRGAFPSPVKTLNQAYIAAEELHKAKPEKKKIEIILLDDIVCDNVLLTELSKGFSVVVKSYDSTSASTLTVDSCLELPVDTTFDNIIIKSTVKTGTAEIFANGNKLICTENLTVNAVSGHYPAIYGGTRGNTVLEQTNLEIFGGTWNQIFGGSKTAPVTNVNLSVGGSVDTKNVGSTAENVTGVFGGGENGTVDTVNLSIDGGSYYRVLGGGLNEAAAVQGDITVNFNHGTIDRLYGGGQQAQTKGNITVNIGKNKTEDEAIIESIFRGSGLYAGVETGWKATTNVYNGANIQEGVQFAAGGYSGSLDETELNVLGGIINCDIFAGGWGEDKPGDYGNVSKSTTLNIKGGTIIGDVYGGGNLGLVNGKDGNATATVNVTGGTISGNVYGGGNAAGVDKSKVTIESGAKIGLNVYGGSYNIEHHDGDIQKTSEVILKGAAITGETGGCVFGGSNLSGDIKVNTKVTVPLNTTANAAVYGGGNMAGITGKATVVIDGTLTGNVFGGGKGAVTDGILSDANAKETSVTVNGTVTGNIYGGGELASVGSVDSTGAVTNVTLNTGAVVNGNVYGGGKGEAGTEYAKIYGNTLVNLSGGNVKTPNDLESDPNGSIFGGGEIAPVEGNTLVAVTGGEFSNIFGGNDESGTISGTAAVTVKDDSDATVAHIYGGGRNAACKEAVVNVESNSNATITDVYGGGYGDTAETNVTNVNIAGSTIANVYGGGNAAPTEAANTNITGGMVETLYGGGNSATVTNSANITVNTVDEVQHVKTVFAGNNQAAMNIQPTLNLQDGKIGTLYGGGNKGPMTIDCGLVYNLNDQDIEIETVYGGCNSADVTYGVHLTLTGGKYGTVYGGNNASGAMPSTVVTLAGATVGTTTIESDGTRRTTGGLYGGGNQAETGKTEIILESGKASNVYGGGNAATVTTSVTISAPDGGTAEVTNLFCGNNQADMEILPKTEGLKSGKVWAFYGGCNAGAMTRSDGLTYTFNKPDMHYTYIIGGCNAADVTSEKGVTLNLSDVRADTAIYGGCNEKGNVAKTTINIFGDVSPSSDSHAYTSVFGGGRGEQTTVRVTNIYAQNGTVTGKLYGGSGFGRVDESHVTVREWENAGISRIVITGDVFGGGYGESSVVGSTDVLINTKLRIHDPNMPDGNNFDLSVTEELASTTDGDAPSGETSVKVNWINAKNTVSRICGNVYGGGDMGQVGKGIIYSGTNTAAISKDGFTHVRLQSGYVEGDIYGGGSGKPASGTSYSLQMGAVFGCCQTDVTGGYVGGNVYGGGYQSRVYANPASKKRLPLYYDSSKSNGVPDTDAEHQNVLAAQINIIEQDNFAPIIIGSSVFGGGAKGEGNSTNPTVYTVVGDVEVNIIGQHGRGAGRSTAIYFGQSGGDLGGGLYGDGNLCLVSGEKTVNIRCFNAGYQERGGGVGNKLKTFYSLQRADTVNVQHSRFVLRGAVDLVDENADSTLFSINRVEQLNMRQNSTIKLNEIVNLLGGLLSDEQPTTRYLNRGNNGKNNYTSRGGVGIDYSYPDSPNQFLAGVDISKNGSYDNSDGSIRRVIGNNNRIIHYRNEYMKYLYGDNAPTEQYNSDETVKDFANLKSFNEICVANGKYLEIKKSDTEYGDVKGVFILSLLHANPGAGGGFVYASIGDKDVLNSGSTGAFVCVTKDTSKADAAGEDQPYMIISHNVGGYCKTGDYSYYYWYIKGNKYIYDIKLTGYIGTADTDFESSAVLTEMEGRHYILKKITGVAPESDNPNVPDKFYSGRLVDSWNPNDKNLTEGDKYALELKVVSHNGGTGDPLVKSIGFLHYDNTNGWGIVKEGSTADIAYGKGDSIDQTQLFTLNDLIQADSGITNLELQVVLHKGSAVLTEIRNVPVKLEFDVYSYDSAQDSYITSENASEVVFNLSTSIVRLVPTQDVYLSSGRIYAGVPSKLDIRITGDSAFTVQYITKFMPSAFNTSTIHITESLTTAVEETYLLDNKTGVGFTLDKDDKLIHVTKGAISEYEITPDGNGGYTVTYPETADSEQKTSHQLTVCKDKTDGITFPKGTMITMIAQIDSYTPTYWYYYCNGNETELNLDSFTKMNCTDSTAKFTFENASNRNV